MNHYYFVATLPLLTPGEAPGISRAAFTAACEQHLRPADATGAAAVLEDSGAAPQGGDGFLARWHNAETQLRNAVARTRGARRGVDIARQLRPVGAFDVALEQSVSDAFGRPSPLERERALDGFRWNKADELAGHDAFSTASVLAYAVKLGIAHRWAALDQESGAAVAQALIEQDVAEEETSK